MNKMPSALLMLAATLFSQLAGAYWDAAWTARAKISLNPGGISATVDDVPVVVRLHSGNFDFLDADAEGADLRFIAADDKTELKFQ
ncbi:MAG: DUF2341 domain-containing protein, partial [Nitrosospira sp.]|nr:DUF2341 domain-containing protein [Nitrosospira sp.]